MRRIGAPRQPYLPAVSQPRPGAGRPPQTTRHHPDRNRRKRPPHPPVRACCRAKRTASPTTTTTPSTQHPAPPCESAGLTTPAAGPAQNNTDNRTNDTTASYPPHAVGRQPPASTMQPPAQRTIPRCHNRRHLPLPALQNHVVNRQAPARFFFVRLHGAPSPQSPPHTPSPDRRNGYPGRPPERKRTGGRLPFPTACNDRRFSGITHA